MSSDLETRIRRANPMARPDQLEQLYGEDMSSRLLGDIRKADRMVETTQERTPRTSVPKSSRRGWLIAAAAAVAVLVAGGLFVIAIPGSETAAPPAGTDPVAVVNSAYDSLNDGDVGGWMEHYTADTFDEQVADLYEVLAVAGHRKEALEPCREIGETPGGEAQVECSILEVNDFQGAAGITLTLREVFVVNADSRISSADVTVVSMVQPGYYAFAQSFWDWLLVAHPEVHAANRPQLTTHLPDSPDQMRVALEYLDEFLAQSDVFPVTD